MHRVMELVFQMDNVERGFVMLRDDKKGFKPAVLLYKDEHRKAEARGVALSTTVTEKLMNDRVPLLIYDVGTDERFSTSQSLRMSGIRSAMCAPLIYKDRVFGIFYVDCLSKPYAFSQEELGIFSVIAAEAAISFDNARSHEELARRVVERQALERFLSSNIVEKILANPDEIHLGGENQTVTILFSDIRGFTRMSEHMEPHAVVELLNEYFSEMTDIIFDSGGTLDKYLGDGIMAVYGAPIPKPDDALRATKTAMEMQRALVALNRDWESRGQQPLRMGVGVNTGPVTAGNIGSAKRMDYTVIGDAVNLASRLCSNAAGGTDSGFRIHLLAIERQHSGATTGSHPRKGQGNARGTPRGSLARARVPRGNRAVCRVFRPLWRQIDPGVHQQCSCRHPISRAWGFVPLSLLILGALSAPALAAQVPTDRADAGSDSRRQDLSTSHQGRQAGAQSRRSTRASPSGILTLTACCSVSPSASGRSIAPPRSSTCIFRMCGSTAFPSISRPSTRSSSFRTRSRSMFPRPSNAPSFSLISIPCSRSAIWWTRTRF